jgi:hypothetical protein
MIGTYLAGKPEKPTGVAICRRKSVKTSLIYADTTEALGNGEVIDTRHKAKHVNRRKRIQNNRNASHPDKRGSL